MDSFSVVDITNAVSKALNTDPQNPNAPKKDLLDSSDEAVKIINMVQVNKQALFIKLSF